MFKNAMFNILSASQMLWQNGRAAPTMPLFGEIVPSISALRQEVCQDAIFSETVGIHFALFFSLQRSTRFRELSSTTTAHRWQLV